MTAPFSSRLDLAPWVGQRQATWRFRLVDGPTGIHLGELTPISDSPPALSHDVGRTIKRQLSPLDLGRVDTARIDPIRHRVLLDMLIGGTVYPLGRYMWGDFTRIKSTGGDLSSSALVDEMFIIDQDMESSFSSVQGFISQDVGVDAVIRRLLEPIPNLTLEIEPTDQSAVGTWAAGTSRAKVLADLATQGGYFAPWFDNDGALQIIQSFDPADKIPDIDLDAGNQVQQDSITNTDDLIDAPNRFVVISNGSQGASVSASAVGTYDVPNSAPHSILNRGFVVPDVRDIQVRDQGQAQAVARTIGLAQTVFERVTLSTSPDPRHDSYDVISWDSEQWLELSWSMTLKEGGDMTHTMRKVYSS